LGTGEKKISKATSTNVKFFEKHLFIQLPQALFFSMKFFSQTFILGLKTAVNFKKPVVSTVDKKGGFGYKILGNWRRRKGLAITEDFSVE